MTTPKRPREGQLELARYVKDEVSRQYRSTKRFLFETGIEKSNYYKVLADAPDIGPSSFRALEGALDLPRRMLDWIVLGRPEDMGSNYERAVWKIYYLAITDEMRRDALHRLNEKHDRLAGESGWNDDASAV